MSMQLLTLLQLIIIIALYLGVVVLIPAAVFHKKFENHPFYVRYTAYTCIGNFYVINLVFLLQLLKISNRATLIIGIVLPALIGIAVYHWQDWVKASLMTAGETTHNVMVNTMGFRLFFSRIFQLAWQALTNMFKAIGENISTRWFDWVGTIAIIAIICWQYGSNLFMTYGYTASDMLVHNQWINAMGQNDIFTSGVYPFGFHCIIYFFHQVFGIETYVLLRLFSLLEAFLIHLYLLFLLRLVCKTDSAAYIATGFYVLLNVWGKNAYMRYYSALPQEYGMIFILPSIFFLILFLRERKEEEGLKDFKGFRGESTTMLRLFGINVSLTLAAHFYDTIALGIFCVAFGIAFCRVLFRKGYFGRVVAAGILGLVVAILPMWFAYLGGTPLEGSLRWGLGVMSGTVDDGSENDAVHSQLNQSKAVPVEMQQFMRADAVSQELLPLVTMTAQAGASRSVAMVGVGRFFTTMKTFLSGYVFISEKSSFGAILLVMILLGFVFGGIALFHREGEYGRVILAISLNMLFFCFLLMSKELGVPVLMDKNRTSIYLAYFIIPLLGVLIDFLLNFAMGLFEGENLKKVFPALFAVVCFVFLGLLGWVRQPVRVEAFQKNGAILCLTNIIRENEPYTFNIISANDELRMAEEYGYHYEVRDLLIDNLGLNARNYLSVPSSRVYVFIEKIPGDYDEPYEGSGSRVSMASATKPMPISKGIEIYKGQYRHILMSKLYYWAKAFAEAYENETSIYYEDDEFICYEIRQNVDRPYDLSFDYGFNN